MSFAILIVAIVMGSITLIALVAIGIGTSYSLKKHGYYPEDTRETYTRLRSDLQRISEDVSALHEGVTDLIIMNHDRATNRSSTLR